MTVLFINISQFYAKVLLTVKSQDQVESVALLLEVADFQPQWLNSGP